jgi:hypothetical protein
VEQAEAVLVAQLFDWYLEPQATVYRLTKRLTDLGVATPTGKPRWNAASAAWHLAQPGLYGPGANQPHPGGAGPAAQVGAAAGRPG